MSVLFKYTIKNVFAKPFRTVLLTICIICCSFVGMLSLDVINNLEDVMRSTLSQVTGTADVLVSDSVGITEPLNLSYDNEQLLIYERTDGTVSVPNGMYTYFRKEAFIVSTMDYEQAGKMRLLGASPELDENEAAVSKILAEKKNINIGDTVSLTDDFGKQHEFTVKEFIPNTGYANGRQVVFLSREGYELLTDNNRSNLVFVDVKDNQAVAAAVEEIEAKVYNGTVNNILDGEELKNMVATMALVFSMIFLVCFFLVIFVAISVSNRIVCERMSSIGTLRSLGISSRFTAGLLVVESAVYGLIGGVIGWWLFTAARPMVYGSIFSLQAQSGMDVSITVKPIQVWTIIVIIMMAVLIMCACPLKEILKTTKLAIRDVIFDNKDTAFVMKRATTVTGLVFLVLAIGTFFIKTNALAQIVCFISIIVSVSLLFPRILKGICLLLSKLFNALNMPVAHLAVKECYTKKSTVGSAVLCTTAAVLSMVIIMLSGSIKDMYKLDSYNCDLYADVMMNEKANQFAYIKDLEGVTDVEIIYGEMKALSINNSAAQDLDLFALNEGGYRLFTAIKNCPEELDNESMAMDKRLADQYGIAIGDEAEICFNMKSYTPITKTLKLVAYIDSYDVDTLGQTIMISKDLYIDINHDCPSTILVNSDNVEKTINDIKKYSSTKLEQVDSVAAYEQYWTDKGSGVMGMLTLVICIGVGLTLIGMISSQLIGFEGRKRECAVLASTAMTKGKVAGMFFLEGLFAYGIALLTAVPAAYLILKPFTTIFDLVGAGMKMNINVPVCIIFSAVLWVVFTIVTLFPIRALRKMKISEQLKYE